MKRYERVESFSDVDLIPSPQTVLFYDEQAARSNPSIKSFVETFENQIPLVGGEDLKTLESFAKIAEVLLSRFGDLGRSQIHILALGGGSVCDFVGFLASVWRRGVKVTLIPSTWLAAIDSAHGGKNGLNFKGVKNQLGTFYFPDRVFLVRDALRSQSAELLRDAYFEVLKIFLVRSKDCFESLQSLESLSEGGLWEHLDNAVRLKWEVVDEDPFETKGVRSVLNFGHTFGHAIESYHSVSSGLSHGLSVGVGMRFALELSRHLGVCGDGTFQRLGLSLDRHLPAGYRKSFAMKTASEFLSRVKMDKKNVSAQSVRFILLKEIGVTQARDVGLGELVDFALKNRWIQEDDRDRT